MVVAEVLERRLGARDPVLVEAVAQPGAAVISALRAVDLAVSRLRSHRRRRIERVVVGDALDDPFRVDRVRVVQRHQERRRRVESLQDVHVVGQRDRPATGAQVVVPCRPREATSRQQACVGVQHGLVRLVRDRAEHLALGRRRVCEQRKRLVAVTGHEHGVPVV